MQPVYAKNNVWLYHGDNVEFMRTVPEGVVDLTVTSPPYDDLRKYTEESAWTFDKFKEVAKELFRITKEGGVVVWNVNDATVNGNETGTSFKQALYFKEIGFNLYDTMIWIKDGGGAIGSQRSYVQNFEYMFIFSKNRPKTVNLICDVENGIFHKIKYERRTSGRRDVDGTIKIEVRKPPKEFKKRNNWWYIAPQTAMNHPAPFPLALARDHILTWSNEGDLVFDPFMGSGTVAEAATRTNRRVMGCEIAKEYVDIQIASLEKEV